MRTSVALAPWGGNWTVFAIYAGSMAGALRPTRFAGWTIFGLAVLTVVIGLTLSHPLIWWLPGVLLIGTTAFGVMSREAMLDRNDALLTAQEEVRRLSQTAERERITRDLHDVLGRTLTLVALKSDIAARLAVDDPVAATEEMRGVAGVAREGLSELRAALAGMAGGSLAREAEVSRGALAAAGVESAFDGDPESVPSQAGAVLSTVAQLAVVDLEASARPGGKTAFAGIGTPRLARFRDRARLLTTPGAVAYAREPLPLARASRELFFDIEVDPFGDRTYLHGIMERTMDGDVEVECFTAHLMEDAGEAEEERAFAAAMAHLTADPEAVIYYWSPYERTMYRNLQARYPRICSREDVDALFASPRTIDLLNDVVAPMTDWPLHDQSIKTIAKHLHFAWRDAEPSGAASIEWYGRWIETGDEAIRTRILDYNEDDCIATRVVLDGLLALPVRGPGERP